MHQMSPGVERAVIAARVWAERLGSDKCRLAHFVLALLDEEEGRPAVLIEQAGLSVPVVREKLIAYRDSPLAPVETALFNAARNWSLTYRHDPEFMTDALLMVVLRADPEFEQEIAAFGLNIGHLERILTRRNEDPILNSEPELEHTLALFAQPDPVGEIDAARVLDANFNRAREAARVLEDYCRFALDDRFLTEQIKELRHELAAIATRLPTSLLLAARETVQDVGTSVSALGEYDRRTPAQVAVTNGKRLQESLRSLEEFGKLFAPEIGRALESLRYRAYTLERALNVGSQSREKMATAKLYVLLTGAQCQAALDWTIQRAAAGGVDIVQLREKSLPDREFLARARDVRRWTRKAEVLFIVNDRPDIARLSEADGVHLGQDDLTIKDARRLLGPEALIGMSTHTIEQVRQAVLDGADYLGIGPVFRSNTKTFDHFPGLEFIEKAVAETSLPAFALGGIGPENIEQVIKAGAKRIAVGSAIAMAEDPEQVSRLLRAGLMATI
jgi:thiamine-phosphate pyrophosphorylase